MLDEEVKLRDKNRIINGAVAREFRYNPLINVKIVYYTARHE